MANRLFRVVLVLVLTLGAGKASAATLGASLAARVASLSDGADAGTVIVSFHNAGGLTGAHLDELRAAGVTSGLTLNHLGMVATRLTAVQVHALASRPSVRSLWANDPLFYDMHQAKVLAGVSRLRTDAAFTMANGGLPFSGRGDFAVVVNDSGIDGTHADLRFPDHVVENVQIVTDTETLAGFTPLLAVEDVPNTDTHVGHGTHVAGIIGGTGQASGGLYQGVAPGARLIGTGSGAGLFILNGLGGFEWSLANQFRHNVRIVSNSWGSRGPFEEDDPINIATREAVDRNIVVVFSASNSGPGPNTHNTYSKAPWVISVGAGTKEGGLVGFSSRGTPREERLGDGDPGNDHDAPTVVAPGTGREFDNNANRFTAAMVSARSSSNVVANGATDDAEIPVAFVPFYTQISGTSMACPFVSGIVALLLEADGTLTPGEIKEILRETATPMPGFEEFEVGSGYVNAYAALDKVLNRGKAYGSINAPVFNAGVTVTALPQEPFTVNFTPQQPGPQSTNTYPFHVTPAVGILDVSIDFGNTVATDEAGNLLTIALHAPDGTIHSTGIPLPLPGDTRRIRIKRPLPGAWVAEVRGVRGVTLSGQPVLAPVGIAVPERVDGIIRRAVVSVDAVPDLAGHPERTRIERLIADRRMDVLADGMFQPDAGVTREDFARTLALNTPLRQSLATVSRFPDVSGDLAAVAEAVTARGSTLRDFDFAPQGMMSGGATFDPAASVNRLDLAVAFVRGLGLDAQAKALAGSVVTSGGQPLTDNAQIPSPLRGYVQIALNRGVMESFPAEVREIAPGQFVVIPGPRFEPATVPTRAALAVRLDAFAQSFRQGP